MLEEECRSLHFQNRAVEEEELKGLTFVSSGENNPGMVPTQDYPTLAFPGSRDSVHCPLALEQELENFFFLRRQQLNIFSFMDYIYGGNYHGSPWWCKSNPGQYVNE